MQGSAVFINIFPVRTSVEEGCIYSASAKQLGCLSRGRAIRAVHHNSYSAQVGLDIVRQPFYVGVAKAGLAGQAGRRLYRRFNMALRMLQQSENFLLNGQFVRVRQFVSIAREYLDAIVSPWIMRGRDHHSGGILS